MLTTGDLVYSANYNNKQVISGTFLLAANATIRQYFTLHQLSAINSVANAYLCVYGMVADMFGVPDHSHGAHVHRLGIYDGVSLSQNGLDGSNTRLTTNNRTGWAPSVIEATYVGSGGGVIIGTAPTGVIIKLDDATITTIAGTSGADWASTQINLTPSLNLTTALHYIDFTSGVNGGVIQWVLYLL